MSAPLKAWRAECQPTLGEFLTAFATVRQTLAVDRLRAATAEARKLPAPNMLSDVFLAALNHVDEFLAAADDDTARGAFLEAMAELDVLADAFLAEPPF